HGLCGDFKLHIERAGGEYLGKLDAAWAQALLVHVLRDGLEHRARRLEAVGKRVVLGQLAPDSAVDQPRLEIPLQIRAGVARDLLPRRHEGGVEVEGDPGMLPE